MVIVLNSNDCAVLESGRQIEFDETVMDPNGNKLTYLAAKKSLLDDTGKVIGIIGASINMTRFKNTQPELSNYQSSSPHDTQSYPKVKLSDHVNQESKHTNKKARLYEKSFESKEINANPNLALPKNDMQVDRRINEINLPSLDSNASFLLKVISHAPGLFFWKDLNGTYLGANNLFVETTGHKDISEVVGKTDYEIYGGEVGKCLINNDKIIIENGEAYEFEEHVKYADGRESIFITAKIPVKDMDNNVIGIIGSSIDITQQKNIENDLVDAKEKAEEASRAKSEFIANMSHDLRTPMHGVSGMQDLVLMAADKSKVILGDKEASIQKLRETISEFIHNVEKYEKTAKRSTSQLIELFNQILESMSLDQGGLEETTKVFNLFDLIERNVMLLQSAALHKKLDLTYCIDEKIPEYLHGLPVYLDRCIGNLLSNSLKFTNQGSIHIDVGFPEQPNGISANQPLDKSFTLMITVSDTGIGIAEDKHKMIFKPFTRLTNSFDGVYKGSGLGLATVKQYVEKMQGMIRLDSEIDKGSTFTILVPVTTAENVKAAEIDQSQSHTDLNPNLIALETNDVPNRTAPIKNVRRRLLVVEDSEPAAVFAHACLSSEVCLVDIAASGGEAFELIAKYDYHLILTDIGLPDMAGVEVIKHIRQLADKQKSSVPIVILTGHAFSKEKRQKFFAMGVSGVLSKPATESELRSVVAQCARRA